MRIKVLQIVIIFLSFLYNTKSNGQIITTFAGNNTSAYSGDTGLATSAAIGRPWGIAHDRYGNIYIADGAHNVIRKVDTSGNISTIVGSGAVGYSGDGGPAIAARLHYPQGIAVDTSGNLYIADDSNYVVRKVTTTGVISTFAGNDTLGYSGDSGLATSASIYGAIGIAIDKKENIYISDGHLFVRKVDRFGIITKYAGMPTYGYSGDGGSATRAAMANPAGLAIDDTGNLYIVDRGNNVIRKVDTFGLIKTVAGNGYAAESGGIGITGGFSGDGGLATDAELNQPYGIALDKWGHLFITDETNNLVRKVDASGIITTIAGDTSRVGDTGSYTGDGRLATKARLNNPAGIMVDTSGNIYFADEGNYVVRLIAVVSIVSTPGDTVCSGTPISFTAISATAGPFVRYQWKVNGANIGPDSSILYLDSLNNGDTISCSLTNVLSAAVITNSNYIVIRVVPSVTPSLTISVPSHTACIGIPFVFTATGINGGIFPHYIWKVDDTTVSSGVVDTFSYLPPASATDTYSVKAILVSNVVCAVIDTVISLPTTITAMSVVVPSVTISSSSSDTLCTGTDVTLTATPVNGGSSPGYSWFVNGLNVATGNPFTYTPVSGDHVRCVLTSSACSSPDTAGSNTIKITVNAYVTPALSVTASSDTICAGTVVSYTTLAYNTGSTPIYTWMVNGMVVATGSSYSYEPINGDSVSCTLISNAVCTTTDTAKSEVIRMRVFPSIIPSISISANLGDTVCAGTTELYITDAINGGPSPAYSWYRGGVSIASGDTFSYAPHNGDVIKCLLTSDAVCATPDTISSTGITMVVNPALTPSLTLMSSPAGDTLCAGALVTYSASVTNGGTAPTLEWKVNGVNSGAGPTYTFIPVNGDTVTCVLTSNAVCVLFDTAVSLATIITVDSSVSPSVRIAPDPSYTVCAGTSVIYTATSAFGGTSPSYQWTVNGIVSGSGIAYTYTPLNRDTVACIITSNARCRVTTTASDSIIMTVNAAVTPLITVTASPGTTVTTTGELVTFTASAINGGTDPRYQWEINGLAVPGATSSTFADSFVTNDSVSCVLSSNALCATSTTATSDKLGIILSLGVSQLSGTSTDLLLLPNPNKGVFVVKGTLGHATAPVDLQVTNLLGSLIYHTTVLAVQGKIDTTIILDQDLPNGGYIFRLRSEDETGTIEFILFK